MPQLKDKIENALNETRILVLVVQVMLAFQLQSIFQKGFDELPSSARDVKVASLFLMLVSAGFLISPASYHRLVDGGRNSRHFHAFITRVVAAALVPFALSVGIDVYVVMVRMGSPAAGIGIGLAASAACLYFWFALGLMHRDRHGAETDEDDDKEDQAMEKGPREEQGEETPLKDRIREVMTELRVVLPGIQALLGFQFAVTLQDSFTRLPRESQYVHLASLFLVAVSTMLLMTPAAYHRISEHGHDTEHFHAFASRMLLVSMALLAPGVCGDVYVVVDRVFHSTPVALLAAGVMLAFFYVVWFGYSLYSRSRQRPTGEPALNYGAN